MYFTPAEILQCGSATVERLQSGSQPQVRRIELETNSLLIMLCEQPTCPRGTVSGARSGGGPEAIERSRERER